MKKKSKSMDEKVEEEIELERTHPEEIISDELDLDKKQKGEEEENPELQKSSLKLVLITLVVIGALLYGIFLITNFMADRFEPTSYMYNGFSFERQDDFWYTTFQLDGRVFTLPFHYDPKSLEDIPYAISTDDLLSVEFIYLSIPPVEIVEGNEGVRIAQGAIEVGKVLGTRNDVFNIPAKAVLSSPSEVDPETSVVTCADASSEVAVIKFLLADRTIVYEPEPYCYLVLGVTGRDVIRSANRLVYVLLGIMDY